MTPINQPPSSFQPSEVHLQDYLIVVMRRRKIFLATLVAFFIGIAIYTFAVKPIYESSTTLHVRDDKKGKGDLLGQLGMSSQSPIDAEIEILKSRTIAEEVVSRLHLNWKVSDQSKGLSFKIADFSSNAIKAEYKVELTEAGGYMVLDSDGKLLGNGRSDLLLQTAELRLLLTAIKGKPGNGFSLSLQPIHSAGNALKEKIRAAEVGKKTSIIRLSLTNNDPLQARDIVNTLAAVYLEQSIAFKTEEAGKTVSFIDTQMNSVRDELDSAEKNLQTYKTGTGVLKLDSEAEELVKKISEVEKERTALLIQKKQVEFALVSLRDALKRGKVYTPAALREDPGVAAMAGKLAELEVQKRGLSAELTDSHPQVKSLQGQIDEIQKKLISIYETNQKNLALQETALAQNLARYEKSLLQLPATERDLARLMRHTKVNADIYLFLLQKHEEARILKASTISNINIIDPAIAAEKPLKPNKKKNLLLGFLVGLMAATGLVFFIEYLDDTIKDGETAQHLLGATLLAIIPFISRKGQSTDERLQSLVVHLDPKSIAAEAFRALRTSLHFSAINRGKKVILMTSTFPGEGKSTVVSNLAVSLAQTGARVILLDCDMRRPSLHEIFGHSKLPGLSEVLAGDIPFGSVLHDTGIERLDFISAGTTPPNPSELLGSEQMLNLLATLRESYDHILIDAPPVLAVTDAPLLTARVDVVLVTIQAERVPVKAAQRMIEMLANVQAPLAGIILNEKTERSSERYGYYGYYGGDSYMSGYFDDDESIARKKTSWWRQLLNKVIKLAFK